MHRYLDLGLRLLFLFAALWALGAGVWLLMSPTAVYSVSRAASAVPEGGQTEMMVVSVKDLSWYGAQGAWGLAVLGIFAALYGGASALARRRRWISATIVGLPALALTVLAGFSIGGLYAPAALAVVVAIVLTGLTVVISRTRSKFRGA